MSGKLICVRHGQSEWNKLNLFTGWVDVSLSKEGIGEAFKVGERLKEWDFDVVFTSTLIRAEVSAMLLLSKNKHQKTPYYIHPKDERNYQIFSDEAKNSLLEVHRNSALNERMYGKLQGMNKDLARKEFGEEQVKIWRRSYDVAPPGGESLKMTKERTIPYFKESILPFLKQGKTVLVVAHGNSLRSIVMEILQLSEKEILEFEIATGEPLYFEFETNRWTKKNL